MTRSKSQLELESSFRASASENAKKENILWYNNFKDDIPQLDEHLNNFTPWSFAIKAACKKQSCDGLLSSPPQVNNKLSFNNSKNINLLMENTMDPIIKPFMMKENSYETFKLISSYIPEQSAQRTAILARVCELDPIDIESYVSKLKSIQSDLLQLDPSRSHHETEASAFMTRLLDNLDSVQKDKIFWLLDQWVNRDSATDIDCFKMGEKLISLLKTKDSSFAQVARVGSKKRGEPTAMNKCGFPHTFRTSHSWDDCDENPKNLPNKASRVAARKAAKQAKSKYNNGAGSSSAHVTQLENQLAATQKLNKLLLQKQQKTAVDSKDPKAAFSAIDAMDDIDEKEAALIELATTLGAMTASVNGPFDASCYTTSLEALSCQSAHPILDSGASVSFVNDPNMLSKPRKHKAKISTADGHAFTQSLGKFKLTNGNEPIFVSALSAPSFKHTLVSIGQLAQKHDVVFTKDSCYLITPSDAPSSASVIGIRGSDNLYRLKELPDPLIGDRLSTPTSVAVPAVAPAVKDLSTHTTMNHSSEDKLAWFDKEYPDAMKYIRKHGHNVGLSSCKPCVIGKARRKPFTNSSSNRYAPLEAISTDTTGPVSAPDIEGNRYLQLLADVGSGWTDGRPMQVKSEASDVILRSLARLQLLCGKPIRRLHSDGAKEQNTADIQKFLGEQGTTRTFTAPASSQSNAIVERRFESLFAAARAALAAAPPPLNKAAWWSSACLDAMDKANYLPYKQGNELRPSPHTTMKLHGYDVDLLDGPRAFLPFGQAGFIVNTDKLKKKLEHRAIPANYLRCAAKDTYKVFRQDKKSITTVRHDEFVLTLEHSKDNNTKRTHDTENIIISNLAPQHEDSNQATAQTYGIAPTEAQPSPPPQTPEKRKKISCISAMVTNAKKCSSAVLRKFALGEVLDTKNRSTPITAFPSQDGGDIEQELKIEGIALLSSKCADKLGVSIPPPPAPKSLDEAHKSRDSLSWCKAWDDELERHDTTLRTWTYEDPLPSDKPLPYTMTFKSKTNMYGGLERHKVRLAIRGDRMRPGYDFDETRTASHMPTHAGRRLLLLGAVTEGHEIRSLDIPGAYMRSPSNPNLRIVMKQPPRSDGQYKAPGKVCVLRRAMPGDKSANQSWDSWRDQWMKNWGWKKVLAEPSMFVIETRNGTARCEADNDDFLLSAPTEEDLDALSKPLHDAWQVTTQKLTHEDALERASRTEHGPPLSLQHVGMKISKLASGALKISNPKIIRKLLRDKGLDGANSCSIPYVISADLSARKPHEPTVDTKSYMQDVGTLRFIADTTHPGIAHIVSLLGRHLHDPCQRHVDALKPIFRYLSSRVDDGIVYENKGPLELTCYTDSDYAGCTDTRRSVSGYILSANGMPLMYGSNLQKIPGHSSTETELVAADTGARNLVYMSNLANELRIPMKKQTATLKIDDKPSIKYHEGNIVPNDANDLHLLVDNKGAFDIAHSYGPSKRTKHMDVRYHYLQHLINKKMLRITLVPTTEQQSDVMTKRVGKVIFKQAMRDMGFPA